MPQGTGRRFGAATSRSAGADRRFCLLALALTIPLGLLWRLLPLHLPPFAFKYGGSALWAMAVYWLLAVLWPRPSPAVAGARAAMVALGIECLKRVYWPPLDRFRETLAGKLLLGRYFTWGAIVAYWLAIASVALLDELWRRISRVPAEIARP